MMKLRKLRLVLIAAPALLLYEGPAFAQGDTEYGPRDIGGTWERYPSPTSGVGSGGRSGADIAAGPEGPAPVPAPPLKPEYMGEWQAEQDRNAALTEAGQPPATNYTHCIGEGMPGMMQGMFPMEILVNQRPDGQEQVTVIQEAYNQVRRIYVGEDAPAPEDSEPRFAGNSGARWDGDTLVIETTGVKDYVGYRNAPHSMNQVITERLTLLPGGEYMQNEITITDPDYLTGPWSWTWMYKRWPDYRMQEYVCEDNLWGTDAESGAATLSIDLGE